MKKDQFKSLLLISILMLSQSVTAKIIKEVESTKRINQSVEEDEFYTDVLNVSELHLSPSYWISKLTEKSQVLMTRFMNLIRIYLITLPMLRTH